MIELRTILITLGILLGILALTTIAAIANKIYSNREDDSKRAFLDGLRKRFLKLRTPEGRLEAMPGIVSAVTGRWSELAAEEICQLELSLRLEVLHALEQSGVVQKYTREAQSRFKWTRAHALRVLGELKLPQSAPALLHALEDHDHDVRLVAARSLGRMKLQAAEEALVGVLGKHDQAVSARIAAICIEMGPRTAPLLIKTMRDGSPKARFWAARILGEIGDPRSVRSLGDAVLDADPEVRSAASWALGRLADPSAAMLVEPLLHDPVWYVRAHAADTLGRIGGATYTTRLASALGDRSWWVRRNALDALVRIGPESKSALLVALEGEDRFARDAAVEALGSLGVTAIAPNRGGV